MKKAQRPIEKKVLCKILTGQRKFLLVHAARRFVVEVVVPEPLVGAPALAAADRNRHVVDLAARRAGGGGEGAHPVLARGAHGTHERLHGVVLVEGGGAGHLVEAVAKLAAVPAPLLS